MNTAAGRCRARPEEDSGVGRGVWVQCRKRPRNSLQERVRAAADIAADEVRVVLFQLRCTHRVAREDAIAKTGRETLDLFLDSLRHIVGRSVGHVAISPTG